MASGGSLAPEMRAVGTADVRRSAGHRRDFEALGVFHSFRADNRGNCPSPALARLVLGRREEDSMETILIIVVVVLLLGGGGFYWRGRR